MINRKRRAGNSVRSKPPPGSIDLPGMTMKKLIVRASYHLNQARSNYERTMKSTMKGRS